MAFEHISEFPPPQQKAHKEKRAPRRLHFPSELPLEEHVAETKRHLEARTTLYLLLVQAFQNLTIGSDQFVYFDRYNPKRCLAPDVFVKRDSCVADFDSWMTWKRGIPDLAVEIVSESDRLKLTWEEKFERYEATGIREVVRFDPIRDVSIRVWDRVGGKLVERSPDSWGVYECKTLSLYWRIETHPTYGPQLRLAHDREGKDLLPTPIEGNLQIAQELADERRARAQVEHEKMLAEQNLREEAQAREIAEEQRRAAEEQRRAAEEQRRAAERKQRAATKKQQAEAKGRELAEAEVVRLRAELKRLQGTG